MSAIFVWAAPASLNANPVGSTVVGGSASVQGQGTSSVVVRQQTDKAIINWQSFNIGAGETTRFFQPGTSSVLLNRVTGGLGPSLILGTLTANGRIFVVNPDGIVFGRSASINTGGFLATTHDIQNNDFMAGNYRFTIPGRPDASIVNLGTITANNNGFAALVAPGVRNSGTIVANVGKVGLASGNGFTLDFYGDKLITLNVGDSVAGAVKDAATGQTLDALVKNTGTLKADGGTVELTTAAARQVVNAVINNTGIIEANTVGERGGTIVLGAQTAATKPVATPTQKITVSGTLSASGRKSDQKGGTVEITGESIDLTAARVDVSGYAGGGKVLIGGDWAGGHPDEPIKSNRSAALEPVSIPTANDVTVDAATTIDSSARTQGNGGKVIVWSDGSTSFAGTIRARGGTIFGDGGFVETSGRGQLTVSGLVDVGVTHGLPGTWLLDPQNAVIDVNAGLGVVTVAAIQSALASGDVIVKTGNSGNDAGDLTVAAPLTWATSNSLTLSAFRDINVNADITNTGGAGAAVNLHADNTGTGVGTVLFNNGAKVSTLGIVSIFYNPSVNPAGSVVNAGSYVSPVENYSGDVIGGGTLNAYMLVNSVYDLQNVQNNLFGNFALGRDIDASTTSGWNAGAGFIPIGVFGAGFVGTFDGQDYKIQNLTIQSHGAYVGLFGFLGNGTGVGTVRNFDLLNANVVALDNNFSSGTFNEWSFVGGAVGWNRVGTVTNVRVSGLVDGQSQFSRVGGLVGYNNAGTISFGTSSATVSGGTLNFPSASFGTGGLVGNNEGGLIEFSSSTGQVNITGPQTSGGGLAGFNSGTIRESFATGPITAVGGHIGGLIGWNSGGHLQHVYALGNVTNSNTTGGTGGLISLDDVGGTVDQSYAAGAVSGNSPGGLINSIGFGGGSATNSYWDTQTTGQPGSAAGTGLLTTQLKSGLPSGFSSSVWGISPGINNGYPYLLWQTASAPSPAVFAPMVPPSNTSLPPNFEPFANGQTEAFAASAILSGVWNAFEEAVKSAVLALIPNPFGASVGSASDIYGAANTAADITVALDKFVQALSQRNKSILDTELGICSSTACTSSEVDQAVGELMNFPGFTLNNMGDIAKLLKLDPDNRQALIRKIFIQYAIQKGLSVEQ